jgi:hypothetical protein
MTTPNVETRYTRVLIQKPKIKTITQKTTMRSALPPSLTISFHAAGITVKIAGLDRKSKPQDGFMV